MSGDSSVTSTPVVASGWGSRGSLYALFLLCLIGLVNYIDRVALSILQVPIKNDLALTDAQIGMIVGFAFFVPYTLLSLPMARLADRYNRKYLLIGALVVWSGMTAAIGYADSFIALLLLRMGVAIGEACCLPTSYSLIADFFRPHQRGRAIAILGTSFPLGSMIGMVGAGMLAAAYGWQNAFLLIGGLGLLLVPLLLLTFREPAREAIGEAVSTPPPPLGEAFRTLWGKRVFRYCLFGLSTQAVVSIALLTWSAPFYVRVHGMSLANASLVLGVLIGGAGGLGTFLGGFLGDRLATRDPRWLMRLPALGALVALPLGLGQFLVGDVRLSVGLGMVAALFANVYLAPTYAVTQSLVGSNLRAFSSAALVTAAAVVGGAIGPWGVGALSDALTSRGEGPDAIGIAVCAALFAGLPAAWFYMRGSAHILDEAHGFVTPKA